MRRRVKLPEPTFLERAERAFEMLVGILAAAAAAVLSLFVVVATLGLLKGQSEFTRPVILFALIMSIPVGAWCVEIAWRLFTSRERADGGGLLSPFLLIFAGLACLALAVFFIANWGLAGIERAIMFTTGAGVLFSLAGTRFRRARRGGRV